MAALKATDSSKQRDSNDANRAQETPLSKLRLSAADKQSTAWLKDRMNAKAQVGHKKSTPGLEDSLTSQNPRDSYGRTGQKLAERYVAEDPNNADQKEAEESPAKENQSTWRTQDTRKGSPGPDAEPTPAEDDRAALNGLNQELGTLIHGLQTIHREMSEERLSPPGAKSVQAVDAMTGKQPLGTSSALEKL